MIREEPYLDGAFGTLLITNGGTVANSDGVIGNGLQEDYNQVTVSGSSSLWTNSGDLYVGAGGAFNMLLITNDGSVVNSNGVIGYTQYTFYGTTNNQAIVTGTNSVWTNRRNLYVGFYGPSSTLLITNGGSVVDGIGFIGVYSNATNSQVIVAGTNSLWVNNSDLYVGEYDENSRYATLLITNGGMVLAADVGVGAQFGSFGNLVSVGNGTLTVTTAASDGELLVGGGGSILFNGGTITADVLYINGALVFNAGTLIARGATVSDGAVFTVGNGISSAAYRMNGVLTDSHDFSQGLVISTNATLTGNGTVSGTVTNFGTISPGSSIGTIILNNSPSLSGNINMEISKNGATLTNDQIQVLASVTYGGSLLVSNLGPTALAAGDSFPLFNATNYTGAFSSITLPSLSVGLMWTNRLLLNGCVAVVAKPGIYFSSVTQKGTNLVFNITGGGSGGGWTLLTSTNLTLALSAWTTNRTGAFDGLGNVSLTNGVSLAEGQRFFTIRSP